MKIKKWAVSVLEKKQIKLLQDSNFYTPDSNTANLVFQLTDSGIQPETATLTLYNKDDESLVSRSVDVVDNELSYQMTAEEIEHAGNWQAQIVFDYEDKYYTTGIVSFHVGGDLLDKGEPKLEIIESWTMLKKQADAMVDNYEQDLAGLNARIDNIITTPAEGISKQEIIDARQGEASLGANITGVKDNVENNKQDITNNKLKVSKVDKELSNYKSTMQNVNTNQEAKQVAEGRRVVDLPQTTGEGHGKFGMQGLTATNLVENGDFRNGIDGWGTSGGASTKLTKDGLVASNMRAHGGIVQLISITEGDKYYLKAVVTGDTGIYPQIRTGTNPTHKYKEINGRETVSFVTTATRTIETYFEIPSRDGTDFTSHNNMLINLTQTFGAGNEPTKEEMDKIYANYFEGTQSVNGNVRVTSGDSTLYIQAPELRSLPNGVYDEIENNTLIKRVSNTGEPLAEPEHIPLATSGNLITHPNGTVYVEVVIADGGSYNGQIEILDDKLPIKELDQLSKMDFTTGLEEDLDVADAVIAEDGLSFTHPDLTTGDIVFFEYYLEVESTDGLASVEYYDSRYTIQDSETDKIYKWSVKVADGVPSIELEEV